MNTQKRIVAIDLLRGFALLGILLMNIMSFAMPDIAYFNPQAFGGAEWWNQVVYGVTHVVADQKFMALFSMLFGAGGDVADQQFGAQRAKASVDSLFP